MSTPTKSSPASPKSISFHIDIYILSNVIGVKEPTLVLLIILYFLKSILERAPGVLYAQIVACSSIPNGFAPYNLVVNS